MVVLQLGCGEGDVEPGDAQHRAAQGMEALLLDAGHQLRGHRGVALRFGHDDGPAGLAHRGHHGLLVQGDHGAQIDHLDAHALLLGGGRGGHAGGDGGPVADQGQIGAGAGHGGAGVGLAVLTLGLHVRPAGLELGPQILQGHLGLGPVQFFGLHEHHRVVQPDGRAQHQVGVRHGGRGVDLQSGRVGVVGLGGVAVVLHAADPPAVGDADDQGHGHGALGAVAHLGDVAGDLLERGVCEGVELHLDDRAGTTHGQTHGGPGDPGLGQRGVEAAVVAEAPGQTVGDAEDPS